MITIEQGSEGYVYLYDEEDCHEEHIGGISATPAIYANVGHVHRSQYKIGDVRGRHGCMNKVFDTYGEAETYILAHHEDWKEFRKGLEVADGWD